jgi:regulator of nucleoside diphosphate kinase
MKQREIYITEHDMKRLRALIEIYNGKDRPYIDLLEEELERAKVVDPKSIPNDVVTMNSVVRIKDLDTNEEKTFTLVFPGKRGATENALSILAPIGTALLGYREGDIVEWEVPAGMKRFQIMEIIYQPERLGNYEL